MLQAFQDNLFCPDSGTGEDSLSPEASVERGVYRYNQEERALGVLLQEQVRLFAELIPGRKFSLSLDWSRLANGEIGASRRYCFSSLDFLSGGSFFGHLHLWNTVNKAFPGHLP